MKAYVGGLEVEIDDNQEYCIPIALQLRAPEWLNGVKTYPIMDYRFYLHFPLAAGELCNLLSSFALELDGEGLIEYLRNAEKSLEKIENVIRLEDFSLSSNTQTALDLLDNYRKFLEKINSNYGGAYNAPNVEIVNFRK